MSDTSAPIASLTGVAVKRRSKPEDFVGKPGFILGDITAPEFASDPAPLPDPLPVRAFAPSVAPTPVVAPIPAPAPVRAAPPEPVAAPTPVAAPAPVVTPAPPARETLAALPHGDEGIVVYWNRLRAGRAVPPLDALDRGFVAQAWSDNLLVAFEGNESAMPRITRLGETNGDIEYTPMVTDWIMSRARQSARRGASFDEAQDFPMDGESPRYRLFLLPFGMRDGAGSDCVLCHLCRIP
jgi:hypothetical protein